MHMAAIGMVRAASLGAAMLFGLAALAPAANAGGFSVREQSTTYLGSAFAGAAVTGRSIPTARALPANAAATTPTATPETRRRVIVPPL